MNYSIKNKWRRYGTRVRKCVEQINISVKFSRLNFHFLIYSFIYFRSHYRIHIGTSTWEIVMISFSVINEADPIECYHCTLLDLNKCNSPVKPNLIGKQSCSKIPTHKNTTSTTVCYHVTATWREYQFILTFNL